MQMEASKSEQTLTEMPSVSQSLPIPSLSRKELIQVQMPAFSQHSYSYLQPNYQAATEPPMLLQGIRQPNGQIIYVPLQSQ